MQNFRTKKGKILTAEKTFLKIILILAIKKAVSRAKKKALESK